MSRYIGAGQNDQFDVRIQELVSKVQNPGSFFHFDTFISKTKYLHSKRAFALKHFTLQDKDEMVALKH